jgi:hypothetical protein
LSSAASGREKEKKKRKERAWNVFYVYISLAFLSLLAVLPS